MTTVAAIFGRNPSDPNTKVSVTDSTSVACSLRLTISSTRVGLGGVSPRASWTRRERRDQRRR